MILQCDQCNTKFRLDDSKLKPGGVKVRCSKCRHVFIAGAELKQEESEFDALLSGLGAPAAEPREGTTPPPGVDLSGFAAGEAAPSAPEPPAAAFVAAIPAAASQPSATPEPPPQVAGEGSEQPQASEFADFDFPADTLEPSQPAAPQAEAPDFSAFESATEAPQAPTPPAAATPSLDFGEFSFDEEPAPLKEEPAAQAKGPMEFGEFVFPEEPVAVAEREAPTPSSLQFGEFEFNAEPVTPAQEPVGATKTGEFGEFSFEEGPEETAEPSAPSAAEHGSGAAGGELDFSEFSFEETPAETAHPPVSSGGTASTAGGLDFGEFSFEETAEEAAQVQEPPRGEQSAAAASVTQFGEFSFGEPSAEAEAAAPLAEEKGAETTAAGEFDFDSFSPSEEPPPLQEEPAAAAPASTDLDFGEFTFSEEPPPLDESAPSVGKPEVDFGEFSFEEPAAVEETGVKGAAPAGTYENLAGKGFEAEPAEPEEFNLAEFSFSESAEAKPAPAGHVPGPAAAESAVAPAAKRAPEVPEPAAAVGAEELDLGLIGAAGVLEPGELRADEEPLPPLSIASRRKGRSIVTVTVIVISILVIVVLSGAGLYLMQSGPAAFDKLGLGFVAKWFGVEGAEEGRVSIRNQQASFYQNKEAGELFVVTGEAVNNYRKARASIHVKVSLYDKNGAVLTQKTAYCGNRLSPEQLSTLPMAKIEAIMNNQFGDSLSNLGVPPGGAIGFVVALPNVPKDAADFGVEVIGSTVAGK